MRCPHKEGIASRRTAWHFAMLSCFFCRSKEYKVKIFLFECVLSIHINLYFIIPLQNTGDDD